MNGARADRTPWTILLVVLGLFGLTMIRRFAAWILEYEWWKELGQLDTLFSTILYGFVPVVIAAVLGFVLLWIAHARGLKAAGSGLGRTPLYAKLSTLALLVLAYLAASAVVDNWTAVLFVGGRQLPAAATAWHDPVFNKPLPFYLFELPFYQMLLRAVLVFAVLGGLVNLGAHLFWSLKDRGPRLSAAGEIEWSDFDFTPVFESHFLRNVVVVFLAAFVVDRYLDRYEMLTNDHVFMVGIDYVDEKFRLPLRWLSIAGCVGALALAFGRKWVLMGAVIVVPMILEAVVPRAVHAVYVRPNEISLQRPYIHRHIDATRSAFGLNRRAKEMEFKTTLSARIDPAKHKPLLDNVRLWDWRAFHDTVTQIQALRPYYVFNDTDVDRYRIDGQLRQVMLTPRELDVRQLPADARGRWMNPHFIYTHGYGVVVAEANRITQDGLPVLMIQNAPPEVKTPSLKLTRPELYFGEVTHEPVFVRTAQPEFNYPSGAENVHTKYEGTGGFPASSLGMRLAAATAYADPNILLTGFLTPESRMMIRRNIRARASKLAGFLTWDRDPYLVLTAAGRLVWMMDGYTTSSAHPYSRNVDLPQSSNVNYIRNSVKATVDAYDGDVHFYIFDTEDPIIQAYAHLFPKLLRGASEMPADLREHARYPEVLFRVQADMYRNFHMKDADSFYNKEDAWDIARAVSSQDAKPTMVEPTYVVATLPGGTEPEFLLMIPFTPRNKDNLIGFMAARCDGDKLGELLFLQLSKQELIFGPLQIEARINQDQNISKDLSLWNQQGSQVLRGQMLVMPIEDTFIYIQPIYIQANQARMPQLKKVAIAVGNSLVYSDTYEQALAEITGMKLPSQPATETPPGTPPPKAPSMTSTGGGDNDRRLDQIRRHFQRYKELTSQGKLAEAGRELEALEAAAKK
ncbi:MAG TPA: UPF0182 family protein [Bryobacteraceae bacterium]|nr:UPF0182 family protein [Bryobacteraceae bacterium]